LRPIMSVPVYVGFGLIFNIQTFQRFNTIDHSAIPDIAVGDMTKKQVLRFGLPKGSLQDATLEKMAKAGWNISVSSRSSIPYVDDEQLEMRLIRAQEISRYVEHGYLDCGITGFDWIQENGSKVHE